MRTNQALLEVSSLHIYTSALLWHSTKGLISKHYTGGYSGDIPRVVWGLDKGERKRHFLIGHKGPVTAIAFSPGGEYITSISTDHSMANYQIIQWDAASYAKLWELEFPTGSSLDSRNALLYSSSSTSILSLTYSALLLLSIGRRDSPAVEMWRWEREQDGDHPSAIVWHPNGATIICGMESGDFLLANAATGEKIKHVPAHSTYILHL